jgi:hypothetical protein
MLRAFHKVPQGYKKELLPQPSPKGASFADAFPCKAIKEKVLFLG